MKQHILVFHQSFIVVALRRAFGWDDCHKWLVIMSEMHTKINRLYHEEYSSLN